MHPRLESIQRIILSVGHGGQPGENYDPGATNAAGETENGIAKLIVFKTAAILTKNGLTVMILPDFGLGKTIHYVNSIGDAHTDWALEIHKDSTNNYDPVKMVNRMGIYYHPVSDGSKEIAHSMINSMISNHANITSWARPDTDSNHGTLGWLRQPKMLSHLIESGFIEGSNDDKQNTYYSELIAAAILNSLDRKFVF